MEKVFILISKLIFNSEFDKVHLFLFIYIKHLQNFGLYFKICKYILPLRLNRIFLPVLLCTPWPLFTYDSALSVRGHLIKYVRIFSIFYKDFNLMTN